MFRRVEFRLAVICLLALSFYPRAYSQEPKLERLLQRSPLPANAICYLHTPSLKKLLVDAKLDLELADKVEELWMVSDLNTEKLTPNWEAGYASMKQSVDVDSLAKTLSGYVDVIQDQKVVWTPKQSYVVPVGIDRVGFLRPAKRNLLADWLDINTRNPVPSFLAEQAKQPEPYLSFMLAINLRNAFSPIDVSNRIASYDSLKNEDTSSIGKLLATIQGVSIIVGRRSLSECIVTIEFSQSPAILARSGSSFFNEVLNRNGSSAPEVASWKTKVEGNKLLLQGPISAESLDSVLGIFSIRGYAEEVSDTLGPISTTAKSGNTAVQIASKEYFSKVVGIIDRVRKFEAQTTGHRAKWNEQQARRIDELGTLNVDADVVDYGAEVSSVLRGNAIGIRSGNVAAGQVQAQVGSVFVTEGGYFGGFYGERDRQITGAQQRMGAYGSFQVALSQIDQLTADVRRAMTEKFKVQF